MANVNRKVKNRADRAEVLQLVVEIVAQKLGKPTAEIKEESDFRTDLGADSLDAVEIIMEFEEAFDINIPDLDAEKLTTVKLTVDFIVSAPPSQIPA